MQREELNEVYACLYDDRRVHYYFKDRYCLDLLGYILDKSPEQQLTLSELKNSQYKNLLNKPICKPALAQCGKGILEKQHLQYAWPTDFLNFNLRLWGWGSNNHWHNQTSRNAYNLVLQLNFDHGHDQVYQQKVKPDKKYRCAFACYDHPINTHGRNTMCWVRMDIDFKTDSVLIEEVQNDWLRYADRKLNRIKTRHRNNPKVKPNQIYRAMRGNYEDIVYYIEEYLKPYKQLWAEAALSAAIAFIKNDLGINNTYYHTYETGIKIKNICGAPPRSLYTKLPKQFGFELIDYIPEMLLQNKFSRRYMKKIKNPQWQKLAV